MNLADRLDRCLVFCCHEGAFFFKGRNTTKCALDLELHAAALRGAP